MNSISAINAQYLVELTSSPHKTDGLFLLSSAQLNQQLRQTAVSVSLSGDLLLFEGQLHPSLVFRVLSADTRLGLLFNSCNLVRLPFLTSVCDPWNPEGGCMFQANRQRTMSSWLVLLGWVVGVELCILSLLLERTPATHYVEQLRSILRGSMIDRMIVSDPPTTRSRPRRPSLRSGAAPGKPCHSRRRTSRGSWRSWSHKTCLSLFFFLRERKTCLSLGDQCHHQIQVVQCSVDKFETYFEMSKNQKKYISCAIRTFYFAHTNFRKKRYSVSHVKKTNFDAPTWLFTGHFFSFLYRPYNIFLFPENLCANIKYPDVYVEFIFYSFWHFKFGFY